MGDWTICTLLDIDFGTRVIKLNFIVLTRQLFSHPAIGGTRGQIPVICYLLLVCYPWPNIVANNAILGRNIRSSLDDLWCSFVRILFEILHEKPS